MPRDKQIKGKQTGNRNEGRQQMDRAGRASEAGRSGGQESHGTGSANTAPVTGEKRSRIGGGNDGGGGSARRSDR